MRVTLGFRGGLDELDDECCILVIGMALLCEVLIEEREGLLLFFVVFREYLAQGLLFKGDCGLEFYENVFHQQCGLQILYTLHGRSTGLNGNELVGYELKVRCEVREQVSEGVGKY